MNKKKGELEMNKKAIWVGLKSMVLAIMAASMFAIPVYAADPWMSVDPGTQTVNQTASWTVYVGKEAGCPERDMKFLVYFGDGYYLTMTNLWSCYPYYPSHTFSRSGDFTQNWFVGEGSNPFPFSSIQTYVHRN